MPNCRLVLDWDWKEGDLLEERCMLVSICKTQSPHAWKLDLDYAQRMLGRKEPDDDSEDERGATPGPKGTRATAPIASEPNAPTHWEERMVGAIESCAMHLGDAPTAAQAAEEMRKLRVELHAFRRDMRKATVQVCLYLWKVCHGVAGTTAPPGEEPPVLNMSDLDAGLEGEDHELVRATLAMGAASPLDERDIADYEPSS